MKLLVPDKSVELQDKKMIDEQKLIPLLQQAAARWVLCNNGQ